MAKTLAERLREHRARRRAAGLDEVRGIWVPTELHPRVKAYAARLLKQWMVKKPEDS